MQQVRGLNQKNRRPDCSVIDDLEDNDNTNTAELQKKIDLWFYGPFIKCLAKNKKTKVIFIGNIIRKTTLLARLSKDIAWNPVVYGCLVYNQGTKKLESLWEELFPLKELLEDLALYKREGIIETWMCEMMNLPGMGEAGFSAQDIVYQNVGSREDYLATFITIDPSFSENKLSDDSAIVCHGIRRSGQGQVLDCAVGNFIEEEIFTTALVFAEKWGAWHWGIESNAAQKLLIPLFNTYTVSRGLRNVFNFLPILTSRGASKVKRITAWVNSMQGSDYAIPSDDIEITSAILNFDLSKKDQKDDLLDACSMGLLMRAEYADLLESPEDLIKEEQRRLNAIKQEINNRNEVEHCNV
jgi:hypothetical protein